MGSNPVVNIMEIVEYFSVVPFDQGDKQITLMGPETYCGEVMIHLDYDDVDRVVARLMVEILNAHWDDEKFGKACAEPNA